jgi:uncharacterized lipoprotein YmbA
MSSMTCRFLALFATLGLAACVSAPTHYYTLVPTANGARSTGAVAPFQFEMQPVLIPVQVDQPQVVVRLNSGALSILETERWSAPLADEFHDALANQLELRLGTRNLEGLPKVSDRPVVSLQTDVRRFDSVPGQYALIDVVWSLSRRVGTEPRRSLTCSSTLRQPAGAQVQDVIMAHQQVIAQLAAVIAGTARTWAQDPGVGCP